LIFGYIGDKVGRKPALLISVVTMGVATAAIGAMPTHAQIGSAAAVALVLLRIAEGLSVGGEFTYYLMAVAAVSFAALIGLPETAGQRGRGRAAGAGMAGDPLSGRLPSLGGRSDGR